MRPINLVPTEFISVLNSQTSSKETLPIKVQIFLFRFGREALLAGLVSLQLDPEAEILLPCLLCEVVLDVFEQLNIKTRYYNLTDQLFPDYDDLVSKISDSTRAIYINHPLGNPVHLRKYQELCSFYKLYLLEDCAHCFLSHINSSIYCDGFSIFSYRKLFPIPDGGGLLFHGTPSANSLKSRNSTNIVDQLAPILFLRFFIRYLRSNSQIISNLVETILAIKKQFKPSFSSHSRSLVSSSKIDLHSISFFSRYLLSRSPVESIRLRRRNHYRLLYDAVCDLTHITPLFDFYSDDFDAYSFPFKTIRVDELLSLSNIHNIKLEPTYAEVDETRQNLHCSPIDSYYETNKLAASIICTPIHQDLTLADLDRIIILLCEHNKRCSC